MTIESTLPPPAAAPAQEEPRTGWLQKTTNKELEDGAEAGTCGHVTCRAGAYLFDGLWDFKDGDTPVRLFWIAVCPACATAANFDLRRVTLADIVTFDRGPLGAPAIVAPVPDPTPTGDAS